MKKGIVLLAAVLAILACTGTFAPSAEEIKTKVQEDQRPLVIELQCGPEVVEGSIQAPGAALFISRSPEGTNMHSEGLSPEEVLKGVRLFAEIVQSFQQVGERPVARDAVRREVPRREGDEATARRIDEQTRRQIAEMGQRLEARVRELERELAARRERIADMERELQARNETIERLQRALAQQASSQRAREEAPAAAE